MVAEEKIKVAADPRRRFGDRGESNAAAFFIARGFTVVARNWSCRMGEIDLVIERDGVTHFVEVKTRRSLKYGYPEESITKTKLRHLRAAIELYLRACPKPPRNYQLDALAIIAEPGKPAEYSWIEGIG